MSHFFLTTVPQDGRLYEIVPRFLYSRTVPAHLRNTRDVIVFLHGSFTNLTHLRRDLQGSDLSAEEILAALYLSDRGFSEIRGYFSAVVVDIHRRTLLGITDRCCVGELHYLVGQQGQITLSSQFAQLLPYSAKRLNEYALSSFFCLGDVERQATLIDDIKRITQFYTLHFDGRLTIRSDYLATLASIPTHSAHRFQDVLDCLELLLRRYIANLTLEYGHLSNTLSGGVDSSYLQALLLEEHHVNSFSIAFDPYGRDNVYACEVASYLGTTHEALTLSANEFLRCIKRGIEVTGKPYMYQGEAMFLRLYEYIAERFPKATIVSGQTADGALDSTLARPIRIALQMSRQLPHQLLELMLNYLDGEWRGLAADIKTGTITSGSIRRIERRSVIDGRVERYLGFSHDALVHIADMANMFEGKWEDKLAKAHLYSGEMRRIPNMLHGLAESLGLTIVLPFLDPVFLEYALTIPARLKRSKYLGKKLAERHISRRYVHRPKISKGVRYGQLFTEEQQWVELLSVIKRVGYYHFDIDEMITGQEYGLILRLVNFHIWKRHVVDSA